MRPLLLSVLIGAFVPRAGITGLRVAPASDRTEVIIHVDGDVNVKNFALANPHRVVLDITGAKQGSALQFSDIKRGGVSGLRVGQYQRDIVRVVIDVTQRVNYHIEQTAEGIVVTFPNPEGLFEPWTSSLGARAAKTETKASEPAPRSVTPVAASSWGRPDGASPSSTQP